MTDFLIKALATWRVANMLLDERGPYDILTLIREWRGVRHNPNEDAKGEPVSWPDNSIFECLWCMSVWVGAFFMLAPRRIAEPFAFSAASVLIRWTMEWLDRR